MTVACGFRMNLWGLVDFLVYKSINVAQARRLSHGSGTLTSSLRSLLFNLVILTGQPADAPYGVWPAPAVTAVTLSWCVEETAQPVVVNATAIAWVWLGGKTFSWAAGVGLQVAAG